MSQRNSETDGMTMGLALVGVVFAALFFVLYAVACFVAVVFTILALCAWNQPLTLHKWTITPREARVFIGCGLAGMVAVPVFVVFCAALLQARIQADWWGYILLGGYSVGALGLGGFILDEEQNQAAANVLALPPPAPPSSPALPQPPTGPFRFASWDDEQPGSGDADGRGNGR